MTSVVICSIARTPIAKFRGSLSNMKGSELGSVAIRGALAKLNNEDVTIREAFLGNVVSAGMGQNPGASKVNFERKLWTEVSAAPLFSHRHLSCP